MDEIPTPNFLYIERWAISEINKLDSEKDHDKLAVLVFLVGITRKVKRYFQTSIEEDGYEAF